MKLPGFFTKPKRLKVPLLVRRVAGASMLPVLPEGRLVVASRWFRRLRPGDVIIFHHNGLDKIKRIEALRPGKVYVMGTNPVHSTDSRHFGWLDKDRITAKVLMLSRVKTHA